MAKLKRVENQDEMLSLIADMTDDERVEMVADILLELALEEDGVGTGEK